MKKSTRQKKDRRKSAEIKERILTNPGYLLYSTTVADFICAALAQSVERRLGKAEVGGSSPLGSLQK